MTRTIPRWAVIGLLPVVAGAAWLAIEPQIKTAEVKLAAHQQPRPEVIVSGFVYRAPPFSLQTLLVEQPGKEPYRRQVTLDADQKFELTLGTPAQGAYRAQLALHTAPQSGGAREHWLVLPELVIDAAAGKSRQVRARHYDQRGLAALIGAFVGLCLAVGFWATRKPAITRATTAPKQAN